MIINVYVGFDPRETVAFHVLSQSIHSRSSKPVSITPIMLSQLGNIYTREKHNLQSSEFSFSRFLTPFLSKYEGWSLFMDCDMLMLDDIAALWELRDDNYAIQVVKHDHKPVEERKFLNQPQTRYEKKNWSSVILFNNQKCKTLTPEYVNSASGLDLHQFKWLESDELIGEIPHKWNFLVGHDKESIEHSVLHYTIGGPYFLDYENCPFSSKWFSEKKRMNYAENKLHSRLSNDKNQTKNHYKI